MNNGLVNMNYGFAIEFFFYAENNNVFYYFSYFKFEKFMLIIIE